MAKKVKSNLKMRIPAGKATAGPPVGSTLGQHGLNLMDFVSAFNDRTKNMSGNVIVHMQVFEDRTFAFTVIGEPVDDQIRAAAGIQKGSARSHADKVGKITKDQVRAIAESKMEFLNANDIEAAMKTVAGTARSMGVEIEG
jgi:large subunit ribosomal protein L11